MCLPHNTPGRVRGGGHDYPAVMLGGVASDPSAAVTAIAAEAEVDTDLSRAGRAYLDAMQASDAEIWDGPILSYDRIVGASVQCRRSSYFTMLATSGALAAELSDAGGAPALDELPLRKRAVAMSGGDPIASGRGRAAAVGLNIALIARGGGGRQTLLGRRSAQMAALPGLWSFVAGNIEPADGARPLPTALARELEEELPALATGDAAAAAEKAIVHGACMSLGRLGPSLIASSEIDCNIGDLGALDRSEFDATRVVDLDDPEGCWAGMAPGLMVPASAALMASLLRDT